MSLQAIRTSRAQVAVMVAALYVAKLIVAAALCVATPGTVDDARVADGPRHLHHVVLCTPAGLTAVAVDDGATAGGETAGGDPDGPRRHPPAGLDCPVCASHCKLPFLAESDAPSADLAFGFERAAWPGSVAWASPARVHTPFRSRAPPHRPL